MKLFIDTANINEIREINQWGILSGVTTNPSLIAKEGRVFKDVIHEIVEIVEEGLKAVHILAAEGIKTNVTLIVSAAQALLAAKAGATYVSPFVGRLDDIADNGMTLISVISTIFKNYGMTTEIIAASIRGPQDVVDAAKCGAHIATVPYKVLRQMVKHPLTDAGIDRFLADWASVPSGKQ